MSPAPLIDFETFFCTDMYKIPRLLYKIQQTIRYRILSTYGRLKLHIQICTKFGVCCNITKNVKNF